MENLAVFGGGVAAANVALLSSALAGTSAAASSIASIPTINALCFAYLALRVAYNAIYVWGQDGARSARFAPLRSVVWTASSLCATGLWIVAGLAAVGTSSSSAT